MSKVYLKAFWRIPERINAEKNIQKMELGSNSMTPVPIVVVMGVECYNGGVDHSCIICIYSKKS